MRCWPAPNIYSDVGASSYKHASCRLHGRDVFSDDINSQRFKTIKTVAPQLLQSITESIEFLNLRAPAQCQYCLRQEAGTMRTVTFKRTHEARARLPLARQFVLYKGMRCFKRSSGSSAKQILKAKCPVGRVIMHNLPEAAHILCTRTAMRANSTAWVFVPGLRLGCSRASCPYSL